MKTLPDEIILTDIASSETIAQTLDSLSDNDKVEFSENTIAIYYK